MSSFESSPKASHKAIQRESPKRHTYHISPREQDPSAPSRLQRKPSKKRHIAGLFFRKKSQKCRKATTSFPQQQQNMEDSDRAVLVSTNGETPTVKRTNSQRRSLARRKILLLNNLDSDIIATGDPIKTACHGSADHDDGLDMSGTSECGQNSDSTGNRESGFSTLSSDSTVSTVTSDETLATENQSMSSWSSADTEKSETMPTAAAAAAGDDDTVWVSSPGDSGIHVTRISVTSDDINDSGTDRDTDIADRVIARLAQDSNLVKRLYSVCDL